MIVPFRPQKRKAPARTVSLPAPVGGWNARDALAAMHPADAVQLQNLWPTTTDVMFRKGYTRYAYGFAAQVETLMWYSSGTSDKFFAIEGSRGWNITVGGDFAAAVADLTGLTNARWQYVNYTTSGGSFLLMVNGADKLRGYNGTAWYADGDATHDITGVDTATCVNINLHKNRVWLVQESTLKAWYLPTSSIAGAAVAFDLSAIAQMGGYLVAMYTWTIDAGYGVDDLAVFITSNGEVIVYRGTDPASASTWALVGVFRMGSPLGARCGMKYGGDLVFLTEEGVVPLAQGLQSSRLDPRVNLTDKIQQAMTEAATQYRSNFGWQLLLYAKANMMMVNVPVNEGSSQQQYSMNTISKSWCNFVDIQATVWELFEEEPYFGGDGAVWRFWNELSDFPVTTATNINVIGLQAFNYFREPGSQKHFRMMRPTLNTSGVPSVLVGVNVDFDLNDNTTPLAFTPTSYGVWDTATWDNGLWGGGLNIQRSWQGAGAIGYCAAPQLRGASSAIETHWMATDLVYEKGGTL